MEHFYLEPRNYQYKRVYEKDISCAMCGFMCVDPCQMDIDHIDGNRENNDLDNLWTLCANCHRLKTQHDKLSQERITQKRIKAVQKMINSAAKKRAASDAKITKQEKKFQNGQAE